MKTSERADSWVQGPAPPPGSISSTAVLRGPAGIAAGELALVALTAPTRRPSRTSPVTTTRSPGSAASSVGRTTVSFPPDFSVYRVVDSPLWKSSTTVA